MKVIFLGASKAQINWGSNDDPNKVCEVGKEYEVENKDIRSMHTKITLVGVEGRFNDVSFRYLSGDSPLVHIGKKNGS